WTRLGWRGGAGWLAMLALGVSMAMATIARGAEPWLHGPSPYRAVYTITSQPSIPRAGYYIEVPDFDLGIGERGIWAYTAAGKALDIWVVGPSRDNGTLVLVGKGSTKLEGELHVYF